MRELARNPPPPGPPARTVGDRELAEQPLHLRSEDGGHLRGGGKKGQSFPGPLSRVGYPEQRPGPELVSFARAAILPMRRQREGWGTLRAACVGARWAEPTQPGQAGEALRRA